MTQGPPHADRAFVDYGVRSALAPGARDQAPASSCKPAKDDAMKLNTALAERTQTQFDAQAIPENHPVVHQLNSLFGDHTFFLDAHGLNIIEPAGKTDTGAQTAQVVKLAGWSDGDRTSLAPHEPELTEVIVVLETAGSDGAA
jgi:hypothetical protein